MSGTTHTLERMNTTIKSYFDIYKTPKEAMKDIMAETFPEEFIEWCNEKKGI